MTISAAILAGGLGTRLAQVTKDVPKVMASVCGRPFIDYVLQNLIGQGVTTFVFCVAHNCDPIVNYLKDGSALGVKISYSFDSDTDNSVKGTAVAIKKALPKLGSAFIIMNGDTLTLGNIGDFFWKNERSDVECALMIYQNDNNIWKSNVTIEGDRVRAYCKESVHVSPAFIDAGVGYFKASIFKNLDGMTELPQLFARLSKEQRLKASITEERFYEINTLESLKEVETLIGGKGGATLFLNSLLIPGKV